MDIRLSFWGAARNVTGSSYLVEANGLRVLVDCGLYQEREFKSRNWAEFPVPPADIDAVLLTHGHLDHCGRLPKLVRDGFKGPIYATAATADIARIIMLDSARIQEEDIKHKRRRHQRSGRKSPYPYEPLYTESDAEQTVKLFKPVQYKGAHDLGHEVAAEFFDAGHVFGSAMIRLTVRQGEEQRTILFSGDVGRWDLPILDDPTQFAQADYVLTESTYGDRNHATVASIPDELARVINQTREAGGNVIIPSFALERTQELLYHLSGLLREDRIPHLMAFVDSPMAIRITEVFKAHPELLDDEARELLKSGRHPCDFPGLKMSRTTEQSKAINHIRGTAIVIAGSGMCTGGRVKHHLYNNIERPESTILFVGYQAHGTLGRRILEQPDTVRILGDERRVAARIEKISGFSGHADRDELVRWLSSLHTPPRRVFITHGEESSSQAFRDYLVMKTGWDCVVPEYLQTVELA